MKGRDWELRRKRRNVFELRVVCKDNKDWGQSVLLSSDRHWDNPKSLWDLQHKHLKKAVQLNAPVLDFGDFFCCMQGKYDRRSSKSNLRPIHQVDDYLDSLISTSLKFFEPYGQQLAMIGLGNHETAIIKNHETNLIERFTARMRERTGSRVEAGGYTGWVIFKFVTAKGRAIDTVKLHYSHGWGGGGQVTADMIQHQRRATYLPDADLVVSGHTHDSWLREFPRLRISERGKIYHDIQTHVKIPSYKDAYYGGEGGWEVGKGMPPKPLGAYWLNFKFSREHKRVFYSLVKTDWEPRSIS